MSGLSEVLGPALLPAIAGFLFLLRFEARRFGIGSGSGDVVRRATWYVLAAAAILLAYALYPQRISALHLEMGADRGAALALGLLLAIVGAGAALALAWLRYGALQPPATSVVPGAIARIVVRAVIDEAAFRAILLGGLIVWGLPDVVALVLAAVLYAIAAARDPRGDGRVPFAAALWLGLAGGLATLATGGIGAALLGHVTWALALFFATGREDAAPDRGTDPAARAARDLPPPGWMVVEMPRPAPGAPEDATPLAPVAPLAQATLAWTGPRVDVAERPWMPPPAWARDPLPALAPGRPAGPPPGFPQLPSGPAGWAPAGPPPAPWPPAPAPSGPPPGFPQPPPGPSGWAPAGPPPAAPVAPPPLPPPSARPGGRGA